MHYYTLQGAILATLGILLCFILVGYLLRNKEKATMFLLFSGGAACLLGFALAPLTNGVSFLGFMFGWPVGFTGACAITFKRLAL